MRKVKRAIKHPELIPPYLLSKANSLKIEVVMRYYRLSSDSYTEAYRKLMRYRIKDQGIRKAVGSDDQGIGSLQFTFMKTMGLEPDDKLLDLGCGSLRGGEYYIDYLNRGNYTGMDISREAIEGGKDLIDDRLLQKKDPSFYVNEDLTFKEDPGIHDYIIAQSVFTHLPADEIRECLSNLDRVLAPNGEFYATVFNEKKHKNAKNFVYTENDLMELTDGRPITAKLLEEDLYPHPRNQRMVRFKRASQ